MLVADYLTQPSTTFTRLLDAADNSNTIGTLLLTGSALEQTDLYHWRFYATMSTLRSVLFDMTPGSDGQTGTLMISSKSTSATTSSHYSSYNISLATEYTIGQLVDWFKKEKMDQYRFTSEGTGCRHWCVEVLKKLEDEKILSIGSTDQFLHFLASESELKPLSVPKITGQGTFYCKWFYINISTS